MRTCFYLMIALLLALPGCGSGGDEKAPPTSPEQSATTLESVRIPEENLSQAVGMNANMTLEGIYTDGTSKGITVGVDWQSSNTDIATVSDGVVTCLAPGEANITATFQDHSDTVTFIVTDAVLQGVRISEDALSQVAGLSMTLTLEGIFSDGTSQGITEGVDWQSSDSNIAIVSDGVVTCLAPGDVEIVAIFQGQSDTVTFTVTDTILQSVNIPEEELFQAVGFSTTLTLEGFYSDGTVEAITSGPVWSSSAPEIATVSNGIVEGISPGETEITATFQGHSDTIIFTVSDAQLEAVDIRPSNWKINPYTQEQFLAFGLFSDGEDRLITDKVIWKSSDPMIADVSNAEDSKGLVTALTSGSILLFAEINGIVGEEEVIVKNTSPETLVVDLMNPEFPINHSFPFIAKCLFSDGTYGDVTNKTEWESSQPSVATVNNSDHKGWVRSSNAIGQTRITAIWTADNEVFTESSLVTVKHPVDLELYLEREDDWILYPLPEICDGSFCIERQEPDAIDAAFSHKRYRLEANANITLTDISAQAVGLDEGYEDIEAWFSWSDGYQPLNGRLELKAGDVLYVTLDSNRPDAWDTAKLQWSFGIEGKDGINGNQFLMTIYLQPR